MKNLDVFAKDFQLNGKYFLEASAGTGKTFTIEHIIARSLIENEASNIDKILAMTFSNSAANELKLRIRNNLKNLANEIKKSCFSHKSSLPKYITKDQDVKQVYIKIHNALAMIDYISIFTIHGFCFYILEKFFPGITDLPSETTKTHSQHVLKHAKQFLSQDMWKDVLFAEQFNILLFKFNLETKHSFSLTQKMLDEVSSTKKIVLPQKSHMVDTLSKCLNNLRNFIHHTPQEVFFDKLLLYSQGYKLSSSLSKKHLKSFITLLYTPTTHPTQLLAFYNLANFFSPDNRLVKYKEIQECCLLENSGLLASIRRFSEPEIIWNTYQSFFQSYLKKHYTLWISPDQGLDILNSLLSNSQNNDIIESIRKDYELVLIDEFQDTDKTQWNIFHQLFIKKQFSGNVFLIGDPKQSIYEWRNADLNTYIKAKSLFSSKNQLNLGSNYRSSKPLLNAINVLFSQINPFLQIPEEEPIFYHPLESHKEKLSHDNCFNPIHFIISNSFEEEVTWISNEAQRLHIEQNIPLGNMVILVSDSKQALNFIKQSSLPISFSKNKCILQHTETFFLIYALLDAILHPEDYIKITKVLTGLLFGLNSETIEQKEEFFTKEFLCLNNILQSQGVLAIFYHVISLFGKTLLSTPNGDLVYQEAEKLCSHLSHISKEPFQQLLYLQNILQTGLWEESLSLSTFTEDLDTIKITTIHSSKGLEYDVVFCVGLNKPQKQKTSSESLREMYVACSRAKYQLYITVSSQKTKKHPSSLEAFAYLANNNIPKEPKVFFHDFIDLYKELFSLSHTLETQKTPTKHISITPPNKLFLPVTKKQSILSFSTISKKENIESKFNKNIVPEFPIGKSTGILIHKILESIPFSLFTEHNRETLYDSLKIFIDPFLKNTPLYPYKDIIAQKIQKLFLTPLNFSEDSFSLSQINPHQVMREEEFVFQEGNIFWKGVIDLFFEFNKRFYIIDWKTSFLGNEVSDYHPHLIHSYIYNLKLDKQADIYEKAISKFLKQKNKNTHVEVAFIFIRGVEEPNYGFLNINSKANQKYPVYH